MAAKYLNSAKAKAEEAVELTEQENAEMQRLALENAELKARLAATERVLDENMTAVRKLEVELVMAQQKIAALMEAVRGSAANSQ